MTDTTYDYTDVQGEEGTFIICETGTEVQWFTQKQVGFKENADGTTTIVDLGYELEYYEDYLEASPETLGLVCEDSPVTIGEPLDPCEFEDSQNCFWNAQEQGNGIGESFVDIDGVAHYLESVEIVGVEPTPPEYIETGTGKLAETGALDIVLPLVLGSVLVGSGIAMMFRKKNKTV